MRFIEQRKFRPEEIGGLGKLRTLTAKKKAIGKRFDGKKGIENHAAKTGSQTENANPGRRKNRPLERD